MCFQIGQTRGDSAESDHTSTSDNIIIICTVLETTYCRARASLCSRTKIAVPEVIKLIINKFMYTVNRRLTPARCSRTITHDCVTIFL